MALELMVPIFRLFSELGSAAISFFDFCAFLGGGFRVICLMLLLNLKGRNLSVVQTCRGTHALGMLLFARAFPDASSISQCEHPVESPGCSKARTEPRDPAHLGRYTRVSEDG